MVCRAGLNGVYQIRHVASDKLYIGSCSEYRGMIYRWGRHRRQLNTNSHHSVKLQRAWNKYSEDAFVFEVLLYCDPQNCLLYEQIALDQYEPEYNICSIAGSRLGSKQSNATKEKIRQSKIGELNPMYGKINEQCHNSKLTQQDVNDIRDWLRYWPSVSQVSIAKMYNVSDNHISRIRRELSW